MKAKPVPLLLPLSVLTAAIALAISGCIHWPREPYADALATPPDPVKAQLGTEYPGAQFIGPVYRRHMDGRRGYRVVSQYFLFKDSRGQVHRAEIDADGRLTTREVRLVDDLPARLQERFFQGDGAPVPGGRLSGRAWVFSEGEPIYEFEFLSSAGRGVGRINESATAVSSYTLRAAPGEQADRPSLGKGIAMAKHTSLGVVACLAAAVVLAGCQPEAPAPAPAPPLTCAVVQMPGTLGIGRSYAIIVTNPSSSEGTNLAITATLPAGQTLFAADGPTRATAADKVVTFAPLAKLAPKARARYMITVKDTVANKPAAPGDDRFSVLLVSDQMSTRIRR